MLVVSLEIVGSFGAILYVCWKLNGFMEEALC